MDEGLQQAPVQFYCRCDIHFSLFEGSDGTTLTESFALKKSLTILVCNNTTKFFYSNFLCCVVELICSRLSGFHPHSSFLHAHLSLLLKQHLRQFSTLIKYIRNSVFVAHNIHNVTPKVLEPSFTDLLNITALSIFYVSSIVPVVFMEASHNVARSASHSM